MASKQLVEIVWEDISKYTRDDKRKLNKSPHKLMTRCRIWGVLYQTTNRYYKLLHETCDNDTVDFTIIPRGNVRDIKYLGDIEI